jgi:hypothetical protein
VVGHEGLSGAQKARQESAAGRELYWMRGQPCTGVG